MNSTEILFWLLLAAIAYAYFGYTVVLAFLYMLKKMFSKPAKPTTTPESGLPDVTLFIAAYNEKPVLKDKIENSRKLDYPKNKLQQLWVTDGSDDGSEEILKIFGDIDVLHENQRKGKSHAINRGMGHVSAPIVVFCDANTILSPDSIKKIVAHFNDPKVGCVAGEKRVFFNEKEKAVGTGEGIYWKYESLIKRLESGVNSTISAAGELFAIRRDLFVNIPDDSILDDFTISLNIAKQKRRIKYEPAAYAAETSSINIAEEMKRKIRIATGGIQTLFRFPGLLNVFRHGFFSFQYFSHKVLRWLIVPFAILMVFFLNLGLMLGHDGGFYHVLFWFQCGFYLLVLIGWLARNATMRLKIIFLPYYLFFMNFSIILGYFRYFSGKHTVKWEKAKRG